MLLYLYIASEVTVVKKTDGSGWTYAEVELEDFAKIGITIDKPWERLRKLSQGNPRKLRFSHLWIGPEHQVRDCETHIKNGGREWKQLAPKILRQEVERYINQNNLDLHLVTHEHLLPYQWTSYKNCPLRDEAPEVVFKASKYAQGREFFLLKGNRISIINEDGTWQRENLP